MRTHAERSSTSLATIPENVSGHQPQPWRCPVCNGRGHVALGFYGGFGPAISTEPTTCRSCEGRGYVVA